MMHTERLAFRSKLLDLLHETFPDYTFEIGPLVITDSTLPHRNLTANTKRLKTRIREEILDDVLWSKFLFYHELDVDCVIGDMHAEIVECVRQELKYDQERRHP